MLSLVRKMRMDVGPLRRHRDFRLLFIGQMVSFLGSMITFIALPYQVFQITHSSLTVGLLGVAEIVPMIVFAFIGGALADAVDRRWMVRITETSLMLLIGVLILNTQLEHPRLWVIFVTIAIITAVDALQRPSLDSLVPRLVARDEVTAAGALLGLRGSFGMIVGPAIGGVLIATIGLTGAFVVDIASFGVSLIALSMMKAVPPPPEAAGVTFTRIKEGMQYALSRQDLMGTYIVDMVAMFFGMPIALFPALAEHYGGVEILGLLTAAPAVGSLIVTATSGWTGAIHRHGKAITIAVIGWGACIALFGLMNYLPLALFFLACAGGCDMISGLFRMTVWNQTIPDELRGRLAGIEMLSYASGPALSGVESGLVARAFTPRVSVVSGGLLCIAGAVICALAMPKFWAYSSKEGAQPQAIGPTDPGSLEPGALRMP